MIEEDGEVIGFANLMTIFSVWSEGYALVIDDLYIRTRNAATDWEERSWKK